MDFGELMSGALPGLFQTAQQGENGMSLLNTYAGGQNQLAAEQVKFANATRMQTAAQNFQSAEALSGRNFIAGQQLENQNFLKQQNLNNQSFQIDLQQNSFNQAAKMQNAGFSNNLAMQQSNQNFLREQQASNQNFATKTALATFGGNFAGSLVSGGLNYLFARGLMNTQASLQRENFDYMTGKAATALTTAGLPPWLAYMPGANSFPKQSQAVNGSNYFSSSLPGNTSQLLWTGSSSQLAFGSGDIPQSV